MIAKYKSFISSRCHPFSAAFMVVVTSLFGVLASSAQTGIYLFTGLEKTITLNPGTYLITAYGAQGGVGLYGAAGGLGAEMSAEFSFSGLRTLTLLVGGSGVGGGADGGGGGSIIDSSATMILAEVSGVASPAGSPNGEIIITAVPVPEPSIFGLLAVGLAAWHMRRRR